MLSKNLNLARPKKSIKMPIFGSLRGRAVSLSGRSGSNLRTVGLGPAGSDHRLFRLENGGQLHRLSRQFRRSSVCGNDHDPGCLPPHFKAVRNGHAENRGSAGRQPDGLVVYHSQPGSDPGIGYHRTGGYDHLRAAAKPQVLPFAAQRRIQIRHTGSALCQYFGGRHSDALCRTAGADGRFPLAVGHPAHVYPFWLREYGVGGNTGSGIRGRATATD